MTRLVAVFCAVSVAAQANQAGPGEAAKFEVGLHQTDWATRRCWAWIRTQIFEINAKATGNPPRPRVTEMLKALLADRFQLKVHTEQREIDAYALVRVRSDGRLGSGLRRRTIDCEAPRPSPVPRPASPRRVPQRFEPPEPPECQSSSIVVNGVNVLCRPRRTDQQACRALAGQH